MRKIFLIAILCLVPFIGQAQELQAPFAHPGLNHSRADLERMKEKVLGKEKPWIDGWDALCAFRDAQSDFKASPKPSLGGTDGTRQRASRDAMAAYYNILRWYVTGDEAHARCAVDILNAWSASVQSVVTGELYMLPACEFMEAAELVRLYPGWKAEDVERFEKMARDYIYPACRDFRGGVGSWPGWDGPANEACLYIGIFLDDAEMVNDAIAYYKTGKGGGCITEGIVFGRQPVEMGRDQPHATIGLDSYADFCQALWNQGVDMYSYQDNLLMKGFEYYAKFNLNHPGDEWVPINYGGQHRFYYPAPSNNAPGSMPNNRVYGNEMVYHHYADRKGLFMPYLYAMHKLEDVGILTGTLYSYTDTSTVHIPHPAPSAPLSLTAQSGIGCVKLQWSAPSGDVAAGYEIQRSSSPDNGFEKIAGWDQNTTTEYLDKTVLPGETYYYRVRALNRSGESDWTEMSSAMVLAGGKAYPAGWAQKDLGKEDWMVNGVTLYDSINGNTFVLTGSGRDIYDTSHPEGNFTYAGVSGDFELTAKVYDGEQSGSQQKEKIGLMVRETTAPDSPKTMLWFGDSGTRYTHFSWHRVQGASGSIEGSDHTWIPIWLKLIRTGNVFEALVSDNGERWFSIGKQELALADECLAGVWVCGGAYRPQGYTVGFEHVSLEGETAAPIAPASIEVTTLGSTYAGIKWAASEHASSYELRRATSVEGSFVPVMPSGSGCEFMDEDLEPSTTYYYCVKAANSGGMSTDSVLLSVTTHALQLPSAPTNLKTEAKNNEVVLSWNPTTEKTEKYIVRRRILEEAGVSDFDIIAEVDTTYYEDRAVENDHTYYYTVAAVNRVGEGPVSTVAEAIPGLFPLCYFSFDEREGVTAHDEWEMTQPADLCDALWAAGRFNTSIYLDKSRNAYLQMPSGLLNQVSDFTISCWVNLLETDGQARVFDFGIGENGYMALVPKDKQTGKACFAIRSGDVKATVYGRALSTNVWTHLVVTLCDSLCVLYVDGVEAGRYEGFPFSPSDLGLMSSCYIGRSQYVADPYLHACIDEFRIYGQALTAGQVKRLKEAESQMIEMEPYCEKQVGDDDYFPARATSGLPVTLSSDNARVAVVKNGRINIRRVGTARITAVQKGDLDFVAALPVEQVLTVTDASSINGTVAGAFTKVAVHGNRLSVNFSAVQAGGTTLGLYAADGTCIRLSEVGGSMSHSFDISGLASGMYILRLSEEGYTFTCKVLI